MMWVICAGWARGRRILVGEVVVAAGSTGMCGGMGLAVCWPLGSGWLVREEG